MDLNFSVSVYSICIASRGLIITLRFMEIIDLMDLSFGTTIFYSQLLEGLDKIDHTPQADEGWVIFVFFTQLISLCFEVVWRGMEGCSEQTCPLQLAWICQVSFLYSFQSTCLCHSKSTTYTTLQLAWICQVDSSVHASPTLNGPFIQH